MPRIDSTYASLTSSSSLIMSSSSSTLSPSFLSSSSSESLGSLTATSSTSLDTHTPQSTLSGSQTADSSLFLQVVGNERDQNTVTMPDQGYRSLERPENVVNRNAAIIGSSGFILVGFTIGILFVRQRKARRVAETQFKPETTVAIHTVTANVTSMTTWINDKKELAVPAFLEMRWNVDFKTGVVIAKGGGGVLYDCVPLSYALNAATENTPIVVKYVSEGVTAMSERRAKAFLQEVALLWKYRDSDLFCHMFAFSESPACIVMKKYMLGDLSDFIRSRGLASMYFTYNKSTVIKLSQHICQAVEVMHGDGIAHCDIKPANVLLDFDSHGGLIAVLTDYGISRVISDEALQVSGFEASDLNGASLPYAAPEVLIRFQSNVLKIFTGKPLTCMLSELVYSRC